MQTPDASESAAPRILVVDDSSTIRLMLRNFLTERGYEPWVAESKKRAQERFQSGRFDAAILDYELGDGNALEILQWLDLNEIDVPVIILTGNATIDLAVQAIQRGAEHFLTKPVDLPAFEVLLGRILENQRHLRQQRIQKARRSATGFDPFLGKSPAIHELQAVAEKVAQSDRPVLILGETGSGKGVLARWIHDHGQRSEEAFVDINCASLSPEFLDSELFGHHRGAFTGATANKSGLLEVGHRGTVFLDEIGDVDLSVQPKLLKVLEEKRFRRMGEVREREVNIRLVAATHRDLKTRSEEKKFRQDLYFRISTLPLEIPPLRERIEDLPELTESILRRLAGELGRAEAKLSKGAFSVMRAYPWPGNLRELRNVLERALLLSTSDLLEPQDLHFETDAEHPGGDPGEELSLQEIERRHIERVLESVEMAVAPAARVLGISRSTLYQKIKAHGLELSRS